MRRTAAFSIFFLAYHTAQALPPQVLPSATLEGAVARYDTGEPISGAQVTVTSWNIFPPMDAVIVGIYTGVALANANTTGVAQANAASIPPATTGPDGKFSFKGLNPGAYRIAVIANGFARQEFGQGIANGQGRPVFLESGEIFKNAAFRLKKGGTVRGRILDQAGQPATGATVQLLRVAYNPQGKYNQSVGRSSVDDRGDYRIYDVPPGRYYLLAGTTTFPGQRGPNGTNSRFSVVYYPDVENLDRATPIEVTAGSEASLNIHVTRQIQTFSVRGRVVDPSGATLSPSTNVMLAYTTFNGGGTFNPGRTFDPGTGNFELRNVAPGEYSVTVRAEPTTGPRAGGGAGTVATQQAASPAASVPIRVVNADIDGLVLTLTPGIPITGRLVVEGQPVSSIPNLDRYHLGISTSIARMVSMPQPVALPFATDGTFQVVGMREGEYRVQMSLPGFYVKSIRYGGEDVLNKPFRFSGAGSERLEVTLHAGAPQVSGTVTDTKSQPVAGIPVYFVPADRNRADLFRSTVTNRSGEFLMANLTPGEYKLFSWDASDYNAHFDTNFVKQYEQLGKTVQVTESSNPATALKLITANTDAK